ncbi:hypothetical protein Fmac_024062 [Flemingia macrophylla]|uniref:DUF3475 domain-containing protein n=1 Tax=Flemingia macrophylla TaxID=520843 RepID=A0ABD1LNA2_9FABA
MDVGCSSPLDVGRSSSLSTTKTPWLRKRSRCSGAVANLCCLFVQEDPSPPAETLGILAFDAAKTMCRLLSLYHSLTDHEILRLRRHVLRSRSLSRLNSADECFLLSLACAERLEDLHLAAKHLEDLSSRCSSPRTPPPPSSTSPPATSSSRSTPWRSWWPPPAASTAPWSPSLRWKPPSGSSNAGATSSQPRPQGQGRMLRRQDPLPPATILYFKQSPSRNRTFDKVVSLMAESPPSFTTESAPSSAPSSPASFLPNTTSPCSPQPPTSRTASAAYEDSVKKHGKKGPPTANGVFQLHSQGDSMDEEHPTSMGLFAIINNI